MTRGPYAACFAASAVSSAAAAAIDAALASGDTASFSARTNVTCDAHQPEHGTQMRLLRIHRGRRAGAVETAARLDDDRTFAMQQPLRPLGGIFESHLGAGDVVEPRLQCRGDAEIVHRRPDDDQVGGLELGGGGIGEVGGRRGSAVAAAEQPAQRRRRQVRHRLAADVAQRHLRARQLGEEAVDELARNRCRPGSAALDGENVGHA